MEFAKSFVELSGCRTHVRRAGKGQTLLFLHGASGMPAILPCLQKLAERFDVVVPEHPGYGQSDEPEWLENIHDMAYFYLDFLEKLDLKDVLLVGNSMGGWIALEIAVRSTARIRSMVVVSPAGVKAPGVLPADTFLMSPEEQVRALVFDQKLADARLAEPMTPEALDTALKNRHTTARLAWEPRFHDPHLPKWLHRIKVPVTIVWGEQDKILPVGFAYELKKLIKNSK
ncbi:MAG TPA: alpha/beta hydrolase, partial [Burkholderiales bacterium]|nr:alpha/beta hydrolase [Burkholderiales bacterium]